MQFEDRRDAEEAYERYNSQYMQEADCLFAFDANPDSITTTLRGVACVWIGTLV